MSLAQELGRDFLALLLQKHPGVLNGLGNLLEPSLFEQPDRRVVEVLLDARKATRGEIPSPTSLKELVQRHGKGQEKPEVRRELLKALDAIVDRHVADPETVLRLARVDLRNLAIDRRLTTLRLRFDADVERRVEFDLDHALRDLHALQAPDESAMTSPGTAAPKLDIDKLCQAAPYFRDVIDAFEPTTDASYTFLIGAGLMAAIGALGKRAHLKCGTDTFYGNLWLLQIAPSGDRKTTPQNIVRRIEREAQGQWVLARPGSPEGFVQVIAEAGGAGIQVLSELGAWLRQQERNYMVGFREMLTELYDSQSEFKIRRVDKKQPGVPGKSEDADVITYPAYSLIAATTRAWLNRNLSVSDLHSGFLARHQFLPVPKRERPYMHLTRRRPPETAPLGRLVAQLRAVQAIAPPPVGERQPPGWELTIPASVAFGFEQWTSSVQAWRKTTGLSPETGPFFERLYPAVLKVALVCAALRGRRQHIEQPDLLAATVLGSFFAYAIPYVINEELALTRSAQEKQRIVTLLEDAPDRTLTKSELLWKSQMDVRQLNVLLQTLVEEERVDEQDQRKRSGKPGPAAKQYTLRLPGKTS